MFPKTLSVCCKEMQSVIRPPVGNLDVNLCSADRVAYQREKLRRTVYNEVVGNSKKHSIPLTWHCLGSMNYKKNPDAIRKHHLPDKAHNFIGISFQTDMMEMVSVSNLAVESKWIRSCLWQKLPFSSRLKMRQTTTGYYFRRHWRFLWQIYWIHHCLLLLHLYSVASLLHLALLPQNSSGRTDEHYFQVADPLVWYGMICHHSSILRDTCQRNSVFYCCQKTSIAWSPFLMIDLFPPVIVYVPYCVQ